MRYTYLGNRATDDNLRGLQCNPVRRMDGKCIISQKMATAFVVDSGGNYHVVMRRFLRLNSKLKQQNKNAPDVDAS